ncbi:hypothetical protein DWB77_04691 [Streptomyces hundungensis]|uniref:Uncharacterized protein n=1 Tax=Streptomyces hundungensis TaxID=1077946 RepID=A0A387HNT1_9ACTN|nr:hypothetical protein DWB77_04691 [Streptomyces hundungensis]
MTQIHTDRMWALTAWLSPPDPPSRPGAPTPHAPDRAVPRAPKYPLRLLTVRGWSRSSPRP